ncbi:MAG TPA: hypothetical protein VMM56_07460 [Planctomycetaceae bacterium]|nr:hypothetical protein [Planctomycetaceae bacterium]
MYRQLIIKELREIWWMGLVAFAFLMIALWDAIGLNLNFESFTLVWFARDRVPFLDTDFVIQIVALTGYCLAGAIALWQTMGESFRGTWVFLLHRPIPRRDIFLVKIAVGLSVTLVSTLVPILLYLWWAVTPGMHASPFELWMTRESVLVWLGFFPIYFAAFLCGIREARWYVSRFFPIVPVLFLPVILMELVRGTVPALSLIAASIAVLIPPIFDSLARRDYA